MVTAQGEMLVVHLSGAPNAQTLLASPSASNSVINSEDAGPPKNKKQQKVLEPS